MVEIFVDPAADRLFYVGKIDHHTARVQFRHRERDNDPPVMSVRMAAFAGVPQQAMPVAKEEFT
jgi:hypothetical protein